MPWLSDPRAPYVVAVYGIAAVVLLALVLVSRWQNKRRMAVLQRMQDRTILAPAVSLAHSPLAGESTTSWGRRWGVLSTHRMGDSTPHGTAAASLAGNPRCSRSPARGEQASGTASAITKQHQDKTT